MAASGVRVLQDPALEGGDSSKDPYERNETSSVL